MTHAFFKALLFLGAGSVIHAVHTQNVFEMGGLWKKMPITALTFLIGCLAIAGIFPFSGFWSKEAILAAVYGAHRYDLLLVALVAAFFTAFYMFRLFFLTFAGKARGQYLAEESPAVMTGPLLVLALLAIAAGFVNTPYTPVLSDWLLDSATGRAITAAFGEGVAHAAVWLQVVALAVSVLGIVLAYLMYGKKSISADAIPEAVPWLYRLSYRKYFVDELYHYVFVRPLGWLGTILYAFDKYVVDGLVNLTAKITEGIGSLHAKAQNGQIQSYGVMVLFGLLLVVVAISLMAQGGGLFGNAQ
jgi:NADH-quinone oxidoreductase subunit L